MGIFSNESNFVVIIWANLSEKSLSSGRPFETMTKHRSRNPVCWRLSFLQSKYAGMLDGATLVSSAEELRKETSLPNIEAHTRLSPLLVPVPLAREVFGWQEFDKWEDEADG